MTKKSILRDKSFSFAVRIVLFSKFLQKEKKEYILFKQVLRSGTAIGALIREAEYAESTKDFIHKLKIALKEANETSYWLALFYETNFMDKTAFLSLDKDCKALIKMLIASIKTLKTRIKS